MSSLIVDPALFDAGGGGGGGFSVVATDQVADTASVTSVSLSKPAGLADNDVVYIYVASDQGVNYVHTVTGFTQVLNGGSSAGRDCGATWLRKVITDASSEPASWTVNSDTADAMAAVLIVVRGADLTTPEDVSGFTAGGTTGGNDGDPSESAHEVTTTVNGCILLRAYSGSGYTIATSSQLSGSDGSEHILGGNSTHVSMLVDYETQATAGATGTPTWTCTGTTTANTSAVRSTVAVQPA